MSEHVVARKVYETVAGDKHSPIQKQRRGGDVEFLEMSLPLAPQDFPDGKPLKGRHVRITVEVLA